MSEHPKTDPAPAPDTRTSADRKRQPIATGLLGYFPRACAAVSEVSRRGNEKHNPGEPMHWAREKSTDEADCAVRHIADALQYGPLETDAEGAPHLASAAWRVLAWLERVLDGDERWRTVAKAPAVTPPEALIALECSECRRLFTPLHAEQTKCRRPDCITPPHVRG